MYLSSTGLYWGSSCDGMFKREALWRVVVDESLKKALTEELCALDRLEEQRGLAPDEKPRKCLVIRDLENSIL
jgi:hypothetical protein